MRMANQFEEKYAQVASKYWWFVSRRKLLDILMMKYNCTGVILEGGCGSGENFQVLQKYGPVIGVDISETLVNYGQRMGRKILLGDITNLPFPDETFSVVVLLDVIEHVDDEIALHEANRVLKPNGKLIVSVPAFNWLWSTHDVINGHRKRYTAKELRSLLLKKHFKVLYLSYWNFTLFLPSAILKKISPAQDNLIELPEHINTLLEKLSSIDNALISRGLSLPIGTSIFAVGEKT